MEKIWTVCISIFKNGYLEKEVETSYKDYSKVEKILEGSKPLIVNGESWEEFGIYVKPLLHGNYQKINVYEWFKDPNKNYEEDD